MNAKPAVYIYVTSANPVALSEICAGLEEEGIPYAIFERSGADVKTLAYDAASHSRLRVGIGITGEAAVLQIRNCPVDKPVFHIELDSDVAGQCRKLGTNAARAVKGSVFL